MSALRKTCNFITQFANVAAIVAAASSIYSVLSAGQHRQSTHAASGGICQGNNCLRSMDTSAAAAFYNFDMMTHNIELLVMNSQCKA